MLASTLPCCASSMAPAGNSSSNRRRSDNAVKPQYQVAPHSSVATWLIVPGTVSSSVPPGFRIRRSVAIAGLTS